MAASACRAGFSVCCIDHFCDADLLKIACPCFRFEELDQLAEIVQKTAEAWSPDWFVPTSGAELLDPGLRRLGSPPSKVQPFMDKRLTSRFFKRYGIPTARDLPDGTYPAFLKPAGGSGGWRNAIVHDRLQEAAWESLFPGIPYLRQEVVRGRPVSVCCVADGKQAVAIATNEQVMRGSDDAPFGFSGSVTPLDHPMAGTIADWAERIAASSGLTGCIGIDFMVTPRNIRAIEINPRFQGTVDTVEAATGVNLFRLHYDACRGRLPERRPVPTCYAARKIIFAERSLTVRHSPESWPGYVTDIPWQGTAFLKGDAVVSVNAVGRTHDGCIGRLRNHITAVQQMF